MTDRHAMVGGAALLGPMGTARERVILHAVAAVVTLLILAPLAWPGYALTYDMVFVPHQPLRWELIAPTTGLPRAVPQDAVVSLLSQVLPGWLLQRVALAGAIYAAAVGAGRLVPADRLLTRVVAAVGYAWTPFLAERLLLGQWGLLLAYGALPWLVAAAIGLRAGRLGSLPRLIVAAAVSAITPTGGLIALATTVVLTAGRASVRRAAVASGCVVLLNAPWLVASVLTVAGGRSDPAGVDVFAARAENWGGVIGALAGTGGIWNAQTTPASRASIVVPILTVVLVAVAAFGFVRLRQRWPGGAAIRLAILAGGGFAVALLGVVPVTAELLEWAVATLPGAGLLRDGQKFLLPYAVLFAVGAALGMEQVAARLAPARGRAVLIAMMVLPLALLPDLAWGGAGALKPVSYPADWDEAARRIAAAPGEVLSLPFSEYRAYGWNAGRTVIDPAPRYFPVDVLVDDRLRVGEVVLDGEDPRAARVRALLGAGQPIASTGVRWVLVQRDVSGLFSLDSLAGLRIVHSGAHLDLYENPLASTESGASASGWRRGALVLANLLAVLLTMVAIVRLRRDATAW